MQDDQGRVDAPEPTLDTQAGLKSQIVHYYCNTMVDVFLAVFRRVEEEHFKRLADAAISHRSLPFTVF